MRAQGPDIACDGPGSQTIHNPEDRNLGPLNLPMSSIATKHCKKDWDYNQTTVLPQHQTIVPLSGTSHVLDTPYTGSRNGLAFPFLLVAGLAAGLKSAWGATTAGARAGATRRAVMALAGLANVLDPRKADFMAAIA